METGHRDIMSFDKPINQLIADVASKHGGNIAITDGNGQYTYDELMAASKQLARLLESSGVTEGDRVLLVFNQGKEAVASMLGVHHTGATYIPVDPSEPAQRLQQIIADCEPRLVLTDEANREALKASLPDSGVACFSDSAGLDSDFQPVENTADSLAYVIYTSGSTGTPKGVTQNHRNLTHFASTFGKALGVTSTDRLTMLYSLNFSASNMDIYSALLNGACVCMYDLKNLGMSRLHQWIAGQGISILHTVPSVFRYIANNTPDGFSYSGIKGVDLGGEAVYDSDVELLKQYFSKDTTCYNHFAASEASVIAMHKVDLGATYPSGVVPAGKPADAMCIRIVDEAGKPVEAGVTGEIQLECDYLSPGYLNREPENQAHFHSREDGTRCYRSGDLGFIDDSGQLHYIGRNDFRVKVNGITIETGEVESAFTRMENIENAVVIAQEAGEGMSQLVAFVTGTDLEVKPIRQQLQEALPAGMIPNQIITRDSLPVTTTGKIDRKALAAEYSANRPEPAAGEAVLGKESIESAVTQIFCSLLGMESATPETNFFEAGGSSLQAMNLVMLLEKNFNIDLPLELIYQEPTIAAISRELGIEINTPHKEYKPQSLLVPLKVDQEKHNLFLIHGRDGHVLVSPYFVDLLSRHHSLYAIRARGLKPGEIPGTSLEGIAADYIREMRSVQPEGPYLISGLCMGGAISIEIAKQLMIQGEVVMPLILIDPPVKPQENITPQQKRQVIRRMYDEFFNKGIEDFPHITEALAARVKDGRINLDTENENVMSATVKIITGLNIAFHTYKQSNYPGEVIVLYSANRYRAKQQHGNTFLNGAKLQEFVVGEGHDDVLDVNNEKFREVMNRSLDYMHKILPQAKQISK